MNARRPASHPATRSRWSGPARRVALTGGAALLLAATAKSAAAAPTAAAAAPIAPPGPAQPAAGRITHTRYGADPAQTMTVYTPPGARAGRPAVLFVHGGCWVRGTVVREEEQLARQISADTGWVVATFGYRTTGPRWATEPADVASALRRLQTGPFGVRPTRTAIWGESAGGHMSLLTAYRGAKDTHRVVAAVSISGVADMRTLSADPAETVLHCVSAFEQGKVTDPALASRYAATSPVTLVTPHTPPTYLANAVGDWIVPPDQPAGLQAILIRNHVPNQVDLVPSAHHSTQLEPDSPTPRGPTVQTRAEAFLRPYLTAR